MGAFADLYADLFALGHCHTVEVWEGGELIGGLYGVHLGRAFFGESMFSKARDASKVALVYLIARLKFGGFVLLDTQFVTGHLARFGAIEVGLKSFSGFSRARFTAGALAALAATLASPVQLARAPPGLQPLARAPALPRRNSRCSPPGRPGPRSCSW